jgi:hypothetical protein
MSATSARSPTPQVSRTRTGAGVPASPAGLYKPIWEYDAKTLAVDLSAHLAYGAGTGTAFWLLAR